MKLSWTILKVLLGLGCIYLSVRIIVINGAIDKLIYQQYDRFTHYKNDPLKDSSTNRKLYAQNKEDVNTQVEKLKTRKYPDWYRIIAVVLPIIAGWLLRDSFKRFRRGTI